MCIYQSRGNSHEQSTTLMCVNYGRNASLHKCGYPEEAYPTTATKELSGYLGQLHKTFLFYPQG